MCVCVHAVCVYVCMCVCMGLLLSDSNHEQGIDVSVCVCVFWPGCEATRLDGRWVSALVGVAKDIKPPRTVPI